MELECGSLFQFVHKECEKAITVHCAINIMAASGVPRKENNIQIPMFNQVALNVF